MDIEVPADTVRVVCPHCHTVNRVPENRIAEAPSCGSCARALFGGHPVALSEAEFEREIANSDVPVIVDFWAPWCGPCRFMAPVFEQAAQALEPRARFVKINTDENQALAMRLNIRSIPTLAIFSGGKEAVRISGALDLGNFKAWAAPHL